MKVVVSLLRFSCAASNWHSSNGMVVTKVASGSQWFWVILVHKQRRPVTWRHCCASGMTNQAIAGFTTTGEVSMTKQLGQPLLLVT
jgi:hypothetical protein